MNHGLQWLNDHMEKAYAEAGISKARYIKRGEPQRLINGPQHGQTMKFDPCITTWVPNIPGHDGRYLRSTDTSFRWKPDRATSAAEVG